MQKIAAAQFFQEPLSFENETDRKRLPVLLAGPADKKIVNDTPFTTDETLSLRNSEFPIVVQIKAYRSIPRFIVAI